MDERYHNLISSVIESKYRQLELDIESDIIRRILKTKKITSTADWQMNRLYILGYSTEDIQAIVDRALEGNEEEVKKLFEEVCEQEYVRNEDLYKAAGKNFIPYLQNKELQQTTAALIKQSNDQLYNITRSMGFMVNMGNGKNVFTPLADIYNGYLDQAVIGMVTGAYDYQTMVRRMVTQMTASGLRSDYPFKDTGTSTGVQYPSGWHNRIDVAARRALLTGVSQVSGHINEMNAEALETEYFEVTWHMGARPEHALWQGKVYTKEQLVTVCGLGSGGGLLGWNCRHDMYPFIPGISERQFSDEWLAEQQKKENTPIRFKGKDYTKYEATQKQRYMETCLRAQREKVELLKKADADPDDILIARCKYQAQLDEYKKFSKVMNLPEQRERIYTARTKGRIAPSKEAYENWKSEQRNKESERAEKNLRADMDAAAKESTKDVEKTADSGTIKSETRPPEKGIQKQDARALKKGIESLEAQIEIHKDRINNPISHYPKMGEMDEKDKARIIRHWEKEIHNFEQSIENRKDELEKRGEPYE